ncbi:unnamed protein product [Calypogeia fissa]
MRVTKSLFLLVVLERKAYQKEEQQLSGAATASNRGTRSASIDGVGLLPPPPRVAAATAAVPTATRLCTATAVDNNFQSDYGSADCEDTVIYIYMGIGQNHSLV